MYFPNHILTQNGFLDTNAFPELEAEEIDKLSSYVSGKAGGGVKEEEEAGPK